MIYEVWWQESDGESEWHTVLGRFTDRREADALVARLGGETRSLFVKFPDDIVDPGPSAKWKVTQSITDGDSIREICPTGGEEFSHSNPERGSISFMFGETWSAEVYASTREEAIARFKEHFDREWTGEPKGFNKWMRDMQNTQIAFAKTITMGGGSHTMTWGWAKPADGREETP